MQGTPKRKGSGSQALEPAKRARWEDDLAPPLLETSPTLAGPTLVSGAQTSNISGSTVTMAGRDCAITTTIIHNHNHSGSRGAQIDVLEILNSLGLPKFRDIQADTLVKGTNGTCLWLTTGEMFLIWVERGKILWGIGIPGAGKTVLASIVIRYLDQLAKGSGGAICVAYVYHRYSEPLSLCDILESLVEQILERHEDLLPFAEELYGRQKRERTRLSQEELAGLLERFASVKTIFFVLDALDELRERDRPILLSTLASLNAKIFITSRPLTTLWQQFSQAQMFNIAANPSDIKLLVQDTLRESPDLIALLDGSGMEGEITETICQKAGGMFLHARLQLEALRHCINIQDVEETLEEFPADIEAVYAKSWERILAQPAKHANLAKLVFLWILCAMHELSVDLLRHLVSTCPKTHIYESKRLVPEALLISVCCGLVSVDPKTQLVRLVHYTTKDAILPRIQELYADAHAIPTLVCVTYLAGAGFQNVEDNNFHLPNSLKDNPLLRYVYYFWHRHAHQCAQHKSAALAVTRFVCQCSRYPWCHPMWGGNDFLGALHVATVYGFDNLIIETGQSHPNACTPIARSTALGLACESGPYSSVKALLSLPGTDVNITDVHGHTPFWIAVSQEDRKKAEALLGVEGIDINIANWAGWTALHLPFVNETTKMIEFLLNIPGIDVNAADEDGRTPLIYASLLGWTEIVELLLKAPGIDPHVTANHRDFGEGPALTFASEEGHTQIVQLLEAFDRSS